MNPVSFISGVFQFFSLYADPFEKKADRFIKRLNRNSRGAFLELIQEDLVKLTIFFEYRFKGYKKLKKRNRRSLYKNAELIAADFQRFFESQKREITKDERLTYLLGIMNYLKPGKRLKYEASATFQKLLRDPASETLVGDCNQITTLYIYLYSRRYPVTDLQVKILPEHICLHYGGVDIETTSATLTEYRDYIYLSGVEEIVAANLLDIPDPSEKQFQISPASMLASAQVAYHFSSHRQTVEKNLLIAYHNMAVYYAKRYDFKNAVLYANKSGNTKLQAQISLMEATHELKGLFDKIQSLKTIGDFKGKESMLRRMKELALKTDNPKTAEFADEILRKLK